MSGDARLDRQNPQYHRGLLLIINKSFNARFSLKIKRSKIDIII